MPIKKVTELLKSGRGAEHKFIFAKVESSCIKEVYWEPDFLFVQFNTGKLYRYANVDKHTFDRLLNASSKGSFLNYILKDPVKYPYVLV